MNILFANYGDIRSNSIAHIGPYANGMTIRGHSCAVAVAGNPKALPDPTRRCLHPVFSHDEILAGTNIFPDSKPASIVHAWTPRESVRKLVQNYRAHHPSARLVIHLEDNEEALMESFYQCSLDQLTREAESGVRTEWEQKLSHPIYYKQFLHSADAFTLLTPTLVKHLPTRKFTHIVSPIIDFSNFAEKRDPDEILSKYGLPNNHKLIVFPGGITSNNRRDVRDLYIAIKLLQEQGVPVIIVKTGPSCELFEQSFPFPLQEVAIDLGYVPDAAVPELLSIADLLIQPGRDNEFNRGRFPCKIPQFFASGKPCIIPIVYKPLISTELNCCLWLHDSSPEEIKEALLKLLKDQALNHEIAANAKTFAITKYGNEENISLLSNFYDSLLENSSGNQMVKIDYCKKFLETRKALKVVENDVVTLNQKIRSLETEKGALEVTNLNLAKQLEAAEKTITILTTPRLTRIFARIKEGLAAHKIRRNPQISKPTIINTETPLRQTLEHDRNGFTHPPINHACHHRDYYNYTISRQTTVADYINKFKERESTISIKPLFSILLPVYNVDEKWLRLCIDSVLKQIYRNWELCIADDASTSPHISRTIQEYQKSFSNIKVVYRSKNGHISAASNSAFTLATGQYIALLDHDDELSPHALAKAVDAINLNPNAQIIYTDEDIIDEQGIRSRPHFKTDWNYDFFLGCNMISHFGIYHRSSFENAGGFREGFEGAQDWDLALRISEQISPSDIVHIPEVLYHWRSIEGSTALSLSQKDYAYSAQKRALESHIARIGSNAKIQSVRGVNWRVIYNIPEPAPRVCVIIPTKDNLSALQPCIESILIKTSYTNFELRIIDNGSQEHETLLFLKHIIDDNRVSVIKDNGEFNFSRINNNAIANTDATLICLLNNDTEVIDGTWLTEMVRHASRPEIGVVGAKLLFHHDHVQHCGVIMGIYDIAGHAFKYLHKDDDGHVGRAKLVSTYSAATGACMVFKRDHWNIVGGFDEINLPISYNDVDFCLRLNTLGYRTIVTPFAQLYHKESDSRGTITSDKDVLQFERESEYMRSRWSNVIANDPYYNPNFTRMKEDFSYAHEKNKQATQGSSS